MNRMARQAPLSSTVSWSLLRFTSFQLLMLSNPSYPLPPPFPFAFSLSQLQGLFQWVGSSYQVARVLTLSFSNSPSNEFSGLISFRMDWFCLLAVQGTLKSLFQHHSLKASARHLAFLMVQVSYACVIVGKTIALTIPTSVCKVIPLLFNMLVIALIGLS